MKYPVCTLASVISPGKYCVVSEDKEHVADVKHLESRLKEEMHWYECTETKLHTRMYVAVIDPDGEFRRGVIEQRLAEDLYEVLLIDYGKIVQTEALNIRVITNKDFMKVEPLAFIVVLYGIIPTQNFLLGKTTKPKACREWLPEAVTFVENLFKNNHKVVVQSILLQDRIVYGEIFVRPSPDSKFFALRKLLCKNEFCVYSESTFLKLSGFHPFFENETVEYESKMEFIRKWQRESIPYQKTNRFLLPLTDPVLESNPEETSETDARKANSPPETVSGSPKERRQVLDIKYGNPESSSAGLPKSLGAGRGKLKLLIAEMKDMKEDNAVGSDEGWIQGSASNNTEFKGSRGRGLLLKKYLEVKKLAKQEDERNPSQDTTTKSGSPKKDFGESCSEIFSDAEKSTDRDSRDDISVVKSDSKVQRAVIKRDDFSEFNDSNDMTELSLSTEDGPPPLIGNSVIVQKHEGLVLNTDGSGCQNELSKTNSDNKSAKNVKITEKSFDSKETETVTCPSDNLGSVKSEEGWSWKQNVQECLPGRFASAKSFAPFIMFDESFVEPVNTFAELPIQPSIIKNLQRGGSFNYLSPIQRWTIPTIRKQQNIVVIGSPKTGKTLSYIVPIIDYVQDECYFEELPEGNGPVVVIVASSSLVCQSIYYMCQSLLGNFTRKEMSSSSIKVVMAHGGGCEKEVWVSLTNGCDILISTPHCLVRLLEMPVITNFERLSTLVLDEIDIISQNPFRKSLKIILERAQFSTKKRHFQKILCGEKFTPSLEDIMRTHLKSYALVIGSYSEAVVYEGLKPNICLVEQSRKAETLVDKLKDKVGKSKVLIMCELTSTAVALKDFVIEKGISALLAHEKMLADRLKAVRTIWRCSRNSVLIATDGILNEFNIKDVQTLIHYELPGSSKTNFYMRYSTLEGFLQFKQSFMKPEDKHRHTKVQDIILIDDENHYQLPHIVDFVTRLGGKISPKIQHKCEEIWRLIEMSKADSPICRNLLSFGRCRKSRFCPRRHALVKSSDTCDILPTSGWVNFVVLRTHDASCLSAKLLEHVDADGKTSKLENPCLEIAVKLLEFYKIEDNRRTLGTPKVGEICAVKKEIEGQEIFYRAKVVEFLKVDKYREPLEVSVKLLDQGELWERKNVELYELPEEMAKCPPTAVDIIVVGIQPMDCDVAWSQVANDFFEGLMTQKLQENQYWSGRIVLALNNTLFLEPIKRKEFLPQLNTHVFDLIVDRELVNNRIAVVNNEHLPPLMKLCGEAGIEISKKAEQKKSKDPTIVQPQWAFFDSDCVQVRFLSAESTSTIFLQSRKFEKPLQELEEDCQKEGTKAATELKTRKGKKGNSKAEELKVGMFCLALFEDGKWNRGRIESETDNQFYVFFVDHGDFLFLQKTDVVPISETLLLRLPCQAVECKLVGIEEKEWPMEVLQEIYSFSDDGQKHLYASIVRKDLEPMITKGRKYCLNLVDSKGISLNKMLVDCKLVSVEESERQHLENTDMGEDDLKEQDEEDEEERWDDEEPAKERIEEKNSETIVSFKNECEDYIINRSDDLFGDENGQALLKEFASRFFPSCTLLTENSRDAEEEAVAVSKAPKQVEETASALEVPNQNAQRLIELYKKRRSKNQRELVLKSREGVLTPQVLWYQTHSEIELKILVGGVKDYHFECTVNNISFRCLVEEKFYAIDFRLFGGVSPAFTRVSIKPFHVHVVLMKLVYPLWPRLHADEGKYRWICLDMDRITEEGGIFSKKIAEAKQEIELEMLKEGKRDEVILPCSDSEESDEAELDYSSEELE